MTKPKKVEVVFVPGCFDDFEGTQEELDETIAEIQRLAETGEIFDDSYLLDIDNPSNEEIEIMELLVEIDSIKEKRRLH